MRTGMSGDEARALFDRLGTDRAATGQKVWEEAQSRRVNREAAEKHEREVQYFKRH